jgi:hypothetical protein
VHVPGYHAPAAMGGRAEYPRVHGGYLERANAGREPHDDTQEIGSTRDDSQEIAQNFLLLILWRFELGVCLYYLPQSPPGFEADFIHLGERPGAFEIAFRRPPYIWKSQCHRSAEYWAFKNALSHDPHGDLTPSILARHLWPRTGACLVFKLLKDRLCLAPGLCKQCHGEYRACHPTARACRCISGFDECVKKSLLYSPAL